MRRCLVWLPTIVHETHLAQVIPSLVGMDNMPCDFLNLILSSTTIGELSGLNSLLIQLGIIFHNVWSSRIGWYCIRGQILGYEFLLSLYQVVVWYLYLHMKNFPHPLTWSISWGWWKLSALLESTLVNDASFVLGIEINEIAVIVLNLLLVLLDSLFLIHLDSFFFLKAVRMTDSWYLILIFELKLHLFVG
jgi:hypothetical protein